ncbi:MAG TPA: PIN domain-containing protein [Anaerolineales bacterium]|nr:PIN domain-containing protein [Anaerolineales bacterium]
MEPEKPTRPRVFMDADVLFAGAASPNEHSASNLILRMAELTLIEAITSTQVIAEVERNLQEKMPKALPAFQLLVSRSLKVVNDPDPTELAEYDSLANPEDLPILVAAVLEECSLLATFNVRHYQPGQSSVTVLKPGDMVLRIRYLLAHLSD